MDEQLFRTPEIEPTRDVISEALGSVNNTYLKFTDGLKNHDIELVWRYYNDGKAWLGKGLYTWTGARGGQKEVTTFWLSVWKGFFKVTIYVPAKSRTELLSLPLDDGTKQMIETAKQMGKLKFFPLVFDVFSEEVLGEIYKLIDFRKMIK